MTEQHRHLEDIHSEEHEKILAIPGWRIWSTNIFVTDEDYIRELKLARENPQSIYISVENGRAHDFMEEKLYGDITPLKYGAFDVPNFILEPLTEEQLAEYGHDASLVSPDELKSLFDNLT